MPTKSQHPETLALHAGYRSESTTTAVGVPIYRTTSYLFRDTPHAANLFGLAELGNIYARIMHPTNVVLEERVAALEGGVAGLALTSGQAASVYAIQNICQAGDNFVSSTRPLRWHLEPASQHDDEDHGDGGPLCRPGRPQGLRCETDARTRFIMPKSCPTRSSRSCRSAKWRGSDASSVYR